MQCPHCQTAFHPQMVITELGPVGRIDGKSCHWTVVRCVCPECGKPVLFLEEKRETPMDNPIRVTVARFGKMSMIFPRGAGRPPAPPEVPAPIASDYNEACLVLGDSPKASAALSRRCLQHLLRECGVSSKRDLSQAIDDALAAPLPAHISDNLDAIRNIGNFSAHPQKSTNSGEILDVEPHEAEWNLDVLESLFDFYYVQPAKNAAKRDALNGKLAEAGKPPLKKP